MNGFKQLLIRCFDTNGNGKLEWSEIIYPLGALCILELIIGILSNFIYDLIKGLF